MGGGVASSLRRPNGYVWNSSKGKYIWAKSSLMDDKTLRAQGREL
jgi:hypothetical protein